MRGTLPFKFTKSRKVCVGACTGSLGLFSECREKMVNRREEMRRVRVVSNGDIPEDGEAGGSVASIWKKSISGTPEAWSSSASGMVRKGGGGDSGDGGGLSNSAAL